MYKKLFKPFVYLFSLSLIVSSCNGDEPQKNEPVCEGVVINGVRWATRNVDMPGTFAENPESLGMLYQWGRNIGWSTTNPMINSDGGTEWDSSFYTGSVWTRANDPCPQGWRVPTLDEIQTLTDADNVTLTWITVNGLNGSTFTDVNTNNTIFLPAAGTRSPSNGARINIGVGVYWSSAAHYWDDAISGMLAFGAGGVIGGGVSYFARAQSVSVRCVAE